MSQPACAYVSPTTILDDNKRLCERLIRTSDPIFTPGGIRVRLTGKYQVSVHSAQVEAIEIPKDGGQGETTWEWANRLLIESQHTQSY